MTCSSHGKVKEKVSGDFELSKVVQHNFNPLLHDTGSTRQLAQPGSRDNCITCYFGRDKILLKIQELKKLQIKEMQKYSTPQDGATHPYSTDTNI